MIKKIRKKKKRKREETVHQALVQYIKLAYPGVIFRSDGAGLRLTMGNAIKFKKLQSCRAYPDLFIAEPVGEFAGLFIEIKKDRNAYLLKSGGIRNDKHIQEQAAVLTALEERGYCAKFGGGFNVCKNIVDDYFKGKD